MVVLTVSVELASIYLALACLSRTHSPWLWGAAGLGFLAFWGLLALHRPQNTKIYTFYSFLLFAAVGTWVLLNEHLVLTLVDWLGIAAAFIAVIVILWPRKQKDHRAGDGN